MYICTHVAGIELRFLFKYHVSVDMPKKQFESPVLGLRLAQGTFSPMHFKEADGLSTMRKVSIVLKVESYPFLEIHG
jgi:hypothetical protein